MRTIALSFALLSLTSCIISSPAKGPVEERTITTTEDITGIAVSGGLNVIIDEAIPYGQVRVLTNSDIFEYVEVEVIDNTLNLGMKSCPIRPEQLTLRIPAYNLNSIAASGGSDVEWNNCANETLAIAASGGADIEIKGVCTTLMATASGGADVDLDELIAEVVTASASGGADIQVYATKQLTVNASGGADVEYSGNPTSTNINTSGGAEVSIND